MRAAVEKAAENELPTSCQCEHGPGARMVVGAADPDRLVDVVPEVVEVARQA